MEGQFFAFLSQLLLDNIATEGAAITLILGALYILYKYVLQPICVKVEKIPTLKELETLLNDQSELEDLNLEEVSKKLEKLIEKLDGVEDYTNGNYREIKELRRDVEHVKQILNQFQGHLMYGGRSGDFGNKELK